MQSTSTIVALSLVLILTNTAHGALLARDLNNDMTVDAYYDTALDITWLKNANLAASNTFGVQGIAPFAGPMPWNVANAWIAAMNSEMYLGYNGWRLPTIGPLNGVAYTQCCSGFDGRFDFGYNITSGQSELAYMYYVNLDNLGLFDVSGNIQSGSGSIDDPLNPYDDNLFDDIRWGWYWSGSPNIPGNSIMVFDMANGEQTAQYVGDNKFAWVVHPGEIGAPIPEPNTFTLSLAGIGLLIWKTIRKRPNQN